MKTFFYALAVLMIVLWALSFFVFAISSILIHALLLLAIILGLVGHKRKSS